MTLEEFEKVAKTHGAMVKSLNESASVGHSTSNLPFGAGKYFIFCGVTFVMDTCNEYAFAKNVPYTVADAVYKNKDSESYGISYLGSISSLSEWDNYSYREGFDKYVELRDGSLKTDPHQVVTDALFEATYQRLSDVSAAELNAKITEAVGGLRSRPDAEKYVKLQIINTSEGLDAVLSELARHTRTLDEWGRVSGVSKASVSLDLRSALCDFDDAINPIESATGIKGKKFEKMQDGSDGKDYVSYFISEDDFSRQVTYSADKGDSNRFVSVIHYCSKTGYAHDISVCDIDREDFMGEGIVIRTYKGLSLIGEVNYNLSNPNIKDSGPRFGRLDVKSGDYFYSSVRDEDEGRLIAILRESAKQARGIAEGSRRKIRQSH